MDGSDPGGFRRFLSVVDGEVEVVDEVLPPLRDRLLENASGIWRRSGQCDEGSGQQAMGVLARQRIKTTHRLIYNPRACHREMSVNEVIDTGK